MAAIALDHDHARVRLGTQQVEGLVQSVNHVAVISVVDLGTIERHRHDTPSIYVAQNRAFTEFFCHGLSPFTFKLMIAMIDCRLA